MSEQTEVNEVDWFEIAMDALRLQWPEASEGQHMLMAGYSELHWTSRPRVLTDADLRALEVLVYEPGARSIGTIASAAAMSHSTAMVPVNRLAGMGVLTRRRGSGRRPNHYTLHPEWLSQQPSRGGHPCDFGEGTASAVAPSARRMDNGLMSGTGIFALCQIAGTKRVNDGSRSRAVRVYQSRQPIVRIYRLGSAGGARLP
jgi:hypothetical protein